jgi:hypothetical protein
MDKVRITAQVLNSATGEVREVVAHVAANDEQEAVNKLFARARRDDYYYRFMGQDGVLAPSEFSGSLNYQGQVYWAR